MNEQSFRLTRLVLSISLLTVFLVSALYIGGNFLLTSNAIDREIERSFEFRAKIAELALREKLTTSSEAVNTILTHYANTPIASPELLYRVAAELEQFSLSEEGAFIDILAVTAPRDGLMINLSSPILPDSKSLIDNYKLHRSAPNDWHLEFGEGDEMTLAIVRSIEIIEPDFGRVVGEVIFGVSLNNNTSLINAMMEVSEVDGISIVSGDAPLSSSFERLEDILEANLLSRQLPLGILGHSEQLKLEIHMHNALRQELNKDLKKDLTFLLILTLVVTIAGFAWLRSVTQQGIDHVIRYAERVAKFSAQETFRPGRITEFNQLGVALEKLVRSVRTSQQALAHSETQLRNILNSTEEGIYGVNNSGICSFANKACLNMLGYEKEQDLVGQNIHELIHYQHADGQAYPKADCPIYRSFVTGEAAHVNTEVFWRADGTNFPTEYWSHPISEGSKTVGAVVTFLDITDRKIADESLRRAQKMDAVGQLTGGIAHDFNNILGIILGNLNLLRRQHEFDAASEQRISTIEKSAQRAADLTKHLLGFSRQKSTRAQATNVNRVIEEMRALFARSVTPAIDIEQYLEDGIWSTEIDPGDFSDVLLNLVINARDAMPDGGKLLIETSNCELDPLYCSQNAGVQTGEYVQVAISDTGAGIAPEHLERIFEPFYTTKPVGKGTGLGLAMVFGFVQRSKGHIKVYSEPGTGTTIRIYLPKSLAEDQHEPAAQNTQTELPRGSETLLVVDDEAELREVAVASLEALGYKVLTASDASEALEILSNDYSIDLLFTDVVMPGGTNGYQLAEKASGIRPKMKILLTSGYTGKVISHTDQARFQTQILSKPYSMNALAVRIRELLGNSLSEPRMPEKTEAAQSYRVGIKEFDDEHTIISELLRRCEAEPDLNELGSILDALASYAVEHLELEECIMHACDYPGFENHVQVHDLLRKQVRQMQKSFDEGKLTAKNLAEFLRDWWLDHTEGMDVSMAEYCSGFPEKLKEVIEKFREN